jgi:hypothetical protein
LLLLGEPLVDGGRSIADGSKPDSGVAGAAGGEIGPKVLRIRAGGVPGLAGSIPGHETREGGLETRCIAIYLAIYEKSKRI